MELENAVLVLGHDVLGVDHHRQGDRAVEAAADALATVDADAFVEGDGFLAGEAELLLPDLDREVLFLDAGAATAAEDHRASLC